MPSTKNVQFQNVSNHIRAPYLVQIADLCQRMTVAREACEEVSLAASASGYLTTVGVTHETHVVGDPNGSPSSVLVTISCNDGSAVDLEWDPMVSEWVVSAANDCDMSDFDLANGLRQIIAAVGKDADECPVLQEEVRVLRAAVARISGL